MKRGLLLTGIALLISAVMMAQAQTEADANPASATNPDADPGAEPDCSSETRHNSRQGSDNRYRIRQLTARRSAKLPGNTESGPGKGEVVREQAQNKGEAQQLKKQNKTAAKNQKGQMNRNAKGNAMKNAVKVQKAAAGAGRK
jgi:hypothetical protein